MKEKTAGSRIVLGYVDGFRFLFRGVKFAYGDHRELAKFYLPPMVLGVLFIIGGWLLFTAYLDSVVNWIWSEPENWFLRLLWGVLKVLIWLICAVATVMTSYISFVIFAAPFNDLISERTEGIVGTWEPRPFSVGFMIRDLGQTVVLELARAGLKLAWLVPLFFVSLIIPVVGQVVYMITSGYILSKYLGMDYVDWTLARRGYTWRERFDFAKANRWPILGFGSAVLLVLTFTFGIGFIVVWPGAVVGGTLLCLELGPEDRRGMATAGEGKPLPAHREHGDR